MLVLKLFLLLLFTIALILLFFRLTGKQHLPVTAAAPELSCWMQTVDDATPLCRIAIPGSHDAGTLGTVWCAETQNRTIEEQLLCGVRYLDLRVHQKGDRFVMFHSIADGMDFLPVLDWIRRFIEEHPSEVLFLDFQHFKGESQAGVFSLLTEHLYRNGLLVENTSGKSDVEFLRTLTLGQARGKCLVFWGDSSGLPARYIFSRNTDRCTMDVASLDSYYISELHKGDADLLIREGHPQYLGRMQRLKEQEQNAFFVLQCQQTDGWVVRGPWFRDRSNADRMSAYVRELKESSALPDLNIVMRDFVTPEKCADIIALNTYKGICKA